MKSIRPSLVWLSLWCLSSCQEANTIHKPDSFQPQLMAIVVEDMEQSLDWYTKVLSCKIEKPIESFPDYGLRIAFLQLGEFHLEIIESSYSVHRSEISPDDNTALGGWFKVGFQVSDIQSTYDQLQQMDSLNFLSGIGNLPENELPIDWPTQYFLLTDPDGNFVQFFDGGATEVATPWLFMNTVKNLPAAISWYSNKLGFTHYETVGEIGNRRAVLARNHCVLELFEPAAVITSKEIGEDSMVLGFSKLGFGIETFDSLSKNLREEQVEITYGPGPSTFPWATQYLIAKDEEGTWIQFFDLKTSD
ncbi:MAG: VOC family protein [Saprospiraceae bacterium]|nr:VOC family protein [Saprospiraceae bacterium]